MVREVALGLYKLRVVGRTMTSRGIRERERDTEGLMMIYWFLEERGEKEDDRA